LFISTALTCQEASADLVSRQEVLEVGDITVQINVSALCVMSDLWNAIAELYFVALYELGLPFHQRAMDGSHFSFSKQQVKPSRQDDYWSLGD
jgi:hypothetical protein